MAGRKKQMKSRLCPQEAGARVQNAKRHTPAFALARELWVEHQGTVAEVCAAADIQSNTLESWRRESGWDEERRLAAQGWSTALIHLRKKLVTLSAELEKKRSESDEDETVVHLKQIRSVIDSAARIRMLDRDIDYRKHALRFWRELLKYLEARDTAALQALEPHIKPFTHEIAQG